ncbi:MAG: class I SAM-dependent methyltransferase [Okeania sp. SIO1I7]|nr:class I SAM-dependent methyltransferase [Okeania sp. SIO1I7]
MATESLDFYDVSSSDILRWDKEWARYLCKYHGNRYFSSLTDRNSQVSKFIKDISKLRADEVYDFKGPASLINIWCDSDNIVGKKIVELGCGPGQLGKQLGHLAVHYLGLDYSNLALYIASIVSPISCEYINIGDKSSIAKFRNSRDTVVTRHFYIHQNISNAIWVSRLAHFLLKPGGLLIADFYYPTQEDFDKNSPNLLPAKSNLQEYPSTVFYFSTDEINEIANICGFEIVDEKIDSSGKRRFVQMRKGVNVNAR